ncbi:MAG: YigZ family protein [Clostridia bacterium]|nr:YigZ family protein [Clostridia bacterium]
MEKFKTIVEDSVSAELVEKKSKFIANLFFVSSVEEAENKIKELKKKYFDARHNCSAYIINDNNEITKKSSDDGEPSGTAGAPMLEILEKNNLANVLVVVTRYFGGILLGTGGLVRAYSDSLKLAIEKATWATQEHGFEMNVYLDYSDIENFKYYCGKHDIKIIDTEYLDSVDCKIELNDNEKALLENDYENQNSLKIKKIDKIRQKNVTCLSKDVD